MLIVLFPKHKYILPVLISIFNKWAIEEENKIFSFTWWKWLVILLFLFVKDKTFLSKIYIKGWDGIILIPIPGELFYVLAICTLLWKIIVSSFITCNLKIMICAFMTPFVTCSMTIDFNDRLLRKELKIFDWLWCTRICTEDAKLQM